MSWQSMQRFIHHQNFHLLVPSVTQVFKISLLIFRRPYTVVVEMSQSRATDISSFRVSLILACLLGLMNFIVVLLVAGFIKMLLLLMMLMMLI